MPYANLYNKHIADQLNTADRNYATEYAFSKVTGVSSGGSHLKIGNASKHDGEDGIYNDSLPLGDSYYYGEDRSGGSAFAEGSFRDTGFDHVEGVGSGMKEYTKGKGHYKDDEPPTPAETLPTGTGGGKIKKDRAVKPIDLNREEMKIDGGSKKLAGGFALSDLGNSDFWKGLRIEGGNKKITGSKAKKIVGGFKLSDLGNSDFWKNLRIEGGGMSGGFKISDLGNSDFWKGLRIEGGKKILVSHSKALAKMFGGTLLGLKGEGRLSLPDGAVIGRGRKNKLVDKEGTLLANSACLLPNGVPPKAQLHSSSMSGQGKITKAEKDALKSVVAKHGGKKPKMASNDLVHIDIEGKGGDRRKARAEMVKKIMKEKGLKMIEASSFIKKNGIKY